MFIPPPRFPAIWYFRLVLYFFFSLFIKDPPTTSLSRVCTDRFSRPPFFFLRRVNPFPFETVLLEVWARPPRDYPKEPLLLCAGNLPPVSPLLTGPPDTDDAFRNTFFRPSLTPQDPPGVFPGGLEPLTFPFFFSGALLFAWLPTTLPPFPLPA